MHETVLSHDSSMSQTVVEVTRDSAVEEMLTVQNACWLDLTHLALQQLRLRLQGCKLLGACQV
jgi:hypothetical protein